MKKLSLALILVAAISIVGCKKKDVPTSVNYEGTTLYFTSGKIGAKSTWAGSFELTGATSETDGEANTALIVQVQTAAGDTTDYPAKRCADLTEGGFDDWYLPSLNELKAVGTVEDDLPGDYTGMYWTSTEIVSNAAHFWHIHYGSQYNNNKGYEYNTLCVRKD